MLIDDRYRLEEAVGHGGMGEVWRASDTVLGRAVAVKLLSLDRRDEKATARFTMEARTAGRLSHPNTVAVYDFGTAGDQLYLVMEYVDGHSLATETATSGPLDPERIARLGAQAASGLAAAHREGIVHRDIKPANLLLTDDDTVKIGDFGIARFADDPAASVTGSGAIVGTTSYLAPERARGRACGPPADMYALGCVLYELLTGRPPFRADTPAATLFQHVERPPADVLEYRDDVPAPLAELVGALLAKDPGHRPTAEQVADRLATPAWRTGQPPPPGNTAAAAVERPPVTPVTPVTPAPTREAAAPEPTSEQGSAAARGARRRHVLVGAVTTVALAATTLGLAALTNDPQTHPARPPVTAGTPSQSPHPRQAAPAPATPNSADIVDAPAGSARGEPAGTAPTTAGTAASSGSPSASPTTGPVGSSPGTPTGTVSPSSSAGGSTGPSASGSPSPSGSSAPSGSSSASGTQSSSGTASASGTSGSSSTTGSPTPGNSSSAPTGSGSGSGSASTAPTAP